ncbi:MAG: hypothetical protein L6R37_002514 [Teloschistes peruensis]|nr:MAG: hypothetical protein L6R37_002514 [Teloschistes peruensis]
MPPEVSQPTIFINAPNGTSEVRNPLYTYAFHPLPSSPDFPPLGGSNYGTSINTFRNTVRYPDANGQSQPDLVNKQLQANAASFHTLTYQLITQQPDYAPFSNVGYSDSRGGRYNSIENMHNGIHMFVGNGGHMSNIPVRDNQMPPVANGREIDTRVDHVLSYNVDRLFALWQAVYPEVNFSPQVNHAGTYTNDPGKSEDSNTPSPFFVHFFLGSPPVDPASWSFDPSLIGSHSVIDASLLRSTNSAPPMYGQIPLNHALLDAGHADLAPEKIVPLLTSGLNWRLQGTDDSPLNLSAVPSLKIHVVAQVVKPRVAEDEFPEYGQLVVYKEITQGKDGGVGSDDDVD